MLKVAQNLKHKQELLQQAGVKKEFAGMAEPKKENTAVFGLMFTVPKICLVLRTKKKVLSKKLGGDP